MLLVLPTVVVAQTDTPKQSATPAQMAEYLVKLAEYDAARAAYQVRATPYWAEVKAKRASRFAKRRAHKDVTLDDYVLTQPPEYTGPKKPIDPSATAADAQQSSFSLFVPRSLNSAPASKTYVVPASSRQKILPSAAQGDVQKAAAPGIRWR